VIPDNIILTWKNENFPSYVFNNIKKLNPDKEILFFSDIDVIKFLSKEYDTSYADFFNTLKLGCTKGDFFRYCYLFKYGGYYCDIDIYHLKPIKDYIKPNVEFFSINSQAKNTTFQALLFCENENEIIYNCISDVMNPLSGDNLYRNTTSDMYKNIKKYLNLDGDIEPKDYIVNNRIVSIGEELAINNCWTCLYNNNTIALSRYPNWLKTNPATDQESGFFI